MPSRGGNSFHDQGAGEPIDPRAFERDLENKQKLLRKWERYFPLEQERPFDVSANFNFDICYASLQMCNQFFHIAKQL